MSNVSQIELQHCRDAALVTGGVFEFTSRYLSSDDLEKYLALYALVQIIRAIPGAPVDDAVKWAKLKWWSDEFAAEPDSASRHPVLRVLWSSGARNKIDSVQLQALVSVSVTQVDLAPDSDVAGLFERLAFVGAASVNLELALDDAEIEPPSLALLTAASGLLSLLSGLCLQGSPEFDRIPLSVLAEYDLNATQLQTGKHQTALAQIMSQLAGSGLDWFSKGMSALVDGPQNRVGLHLRLRWAMEKRRLEYIQNNANKCIEKGMRFGPADAWYAWRLLRKLR
jgi:phytoene/squalene synthetase